MRSTWASPSPGSTATRASSPGPMAPTVSPATATEAEETRWITLIITPLWGRRSRRDPGTRRLSGRGASAAPTEWSREGCARQPALPARRGRRTPALGLVERARRRRGRAVAAAGRARGAGGPAQPGARLPGHGGSGTRGPATADPAHHRTPGAGDAAAVDPAACDQPGPDPGNPRHGAVRCRHRRRRGGDRRRAALRQLGAAEPVAGLAHADLGAVPAAGVRGWRGLPAAGPR